jgi:aspartate/methionine/tyrosine aminotransferase
MERRHDRAPGFQARTAFLPVGIHRALQPGGVGRAKHVVARAAAPTERDAFDRSWLGYTETFGAPDLCEAIAATYEQQAGNILCFAGAEEGLFAAMQALLDRDSHAIVVTPNYQSAETVPLSLCAVTGIPLDPERGWRLDIDRVAAAIRSNTRLISINFPHNPTGKVLQRDRFDALIALCRKHGIWLFSDEVYRLLDAGTGIEHLPQAADCYERALSLTVMSKTYGLAGLRVGWIASSDRELSAALSASSITSRSATPRRASTWR